MSRQWDKDRQFKADYKAIAALVFAGWLSEISRVKWIPIFVDLRSALSGLAGAIFGVLIGLIILATFPVSLPLFCIIAKCSERRRRLYYLRRMRAADADI